MKKGSIPQLRSRSRSPVRLVGDDPQYEAVGQSLQDQFRIRVELFVSVAVGRDPGQPIVRDDGPVLRLVGPSGLLDGRVKPTRRQPQTFGFFGFGLFTTALLPDVVFIDQRVPDIEEDTTDPLHGLPPVRWNKTP